jgi:hypothetical protein
VRIFVETEEEKKDLLRQSKYVHYLEEIDSDLANTLMHIYMNPDCIIVDDEIANI